MKILPIRKLLPWLCAALLVAFAAYRLKFSPIPVIAHAVVPGEVRGEVMGAGTLEARVKTTISARIQERLAEVLADQNDAVKAGQLLARLDDGELKRQVDVAEAALLSAQASLERVRTDDMRAKAVLHQARLNHARVSELKETKVSSQDDLDKAIEMLQVSESDAKRAQAAITESESQVVTARMNVAWQKERLGYAQILSPYDGLVVRRDRDPGGVVVPGASLLQLISTNEIWVSAWVDETAMNDLAVGQPARVVFRSDAGKNYPGEIARLGREADRETREFLVDVRVKELPKNWTVGQRAEVFIETGHRSGVLAMPQRFVQWRDGKAGVFANEQGRAKWREVKIGLRGPKTVEITQGLQSGEQVLMPFEGKQATLADGQRIHAP